MKKMKNEKGVTAIEMIMVVLFFVTFLTLVTPTFKNLMGQNGKSGFVNNVIISKAQDVNNANDELVVVTCTTTENCPLE